MFDVPSLMRYENQRFELSATDLSNHLSCEHLTQLNRKVALGELNRPSWYDPAVEVLAKRGQDHENAYVNLLSGKGLKVISLRGQKLESTFNAMSQGYEVIAQARLEDEKWMGYADILIKVEGKSKFGDWAYEVQDTKLSLNTKAGTILQLCIYTDILAKLQASSPEHMHVVKPGDDFQIESFRFADFQAYYRMIRRNFESVMSANAIATYPDPVSHCSICSWWQECDKKRHDDDHLSLVAGVRTMHVVELQRQDINTLEQFAVKEKIAKPERGNLETFQRKHLQAKIQLLGRKEKKLLNDSLPIEKGRGFNRLPEPNAGDIYFDIEGDVFYPDGGLEYLLGYAYRENGELIYKKIWSSSRLEERKAFVEFVRFVTERWQRYPGMYIYHFAPYEPSAVKRLARVHAIYEKEIDDLLRAERFIDLHATFREALLASVETYSLKELEQFTTYKRQVPLREASGARKIVEIALELDDFEAISNETRQVVEKYNEDDCRATEALHQWLESLRNEKLKSGQAFERPELKEGEATEEVKGLDIRSAALFKALTEKLPEDRREWTDEHKAKWLLAHQVDYFRREDKSAWWEYFRVHELEHEDLLDERKAITGLVFDSVQPKIGRERNVTHRYRFPLQEVSIDVGDKLFEVKGGNAGEVRDISVLEGWIDIKKSGAMAEIHPRAVHVSERVDPGPLATSLMDLADKIDEDGVGHAWPFHASKDLLMKRKPVLMQQQSGSLIQQGEDIVDAAVRLAFALDRSVLPIQGPPGAGKTYTGAKMILALAKAGKKIGITAVSHKVIRNLAEATLRRAADEGEKIQFAHKVKEKSETPIANIDEVESSDAARAALDAGKVVCGTAWLWAESNSRETLDYLFVDEAGQMSLSQVLAASMSAKNLILLGDPQQLEQPQRGAHPEGSDVAALTYLLDGHATMPDDRGLFLGVTRRLHPAICNYTSDLFYEGRLTSLPGLDKQVISGGTRFDGAGLFYVNVEHRGNQNRSTEEVDVVAKVVDELLSKGKWTNTSGVTRPLAPEDILIVAPYNAQVSALTERLPGMRIGTVDKFQGQEAPVVIYSMTASTVDDAPKGMNFLFNPNRLNVATSRAKSACILVASPRLFEPDCNTIDQMRWANAVCRYLECAKDFRH